MKTYEGFRRFYAVLVTVNGRLLDPRLDLYNTARPDSSGATAAAARRNWHWPYSPSTWATIDRHSICISASSGR